MKDGLIMFTTSRSISAVFLAAGLATATPVFAQGGWYGDHRDRDDYGRGRAFDSRAYDNGYREGLEHGEKDARRGRDFAYAHADEYRDADHGYRRSDGDREWYRQAFRRGYAAGYTEGYRGSHGGFGATYPGSTYPVYRGNPNVYQNDRRYWSPATNAGYRDGFAVGRDDANDRDSYNPQRSKRYRSGDRDYDSEYGSRDVYRSEYRSAFLQGYEDGYRGIRR